MSEAARAAYFALFFALNAVALVRADDFGPRGDVARVRSDAVRLLAYRVRAGGADPKTIAVREVTITGNQAVLSWSAGANQRGFMGLMRSLDRWWDLFDAPPRATSRAALIAAGFSPAFLTAAALHNADAAAATATPRATPPPAGATLPIDVRPGTRITIPRSQTAGYQLFLQFSPPSAAAVLTQVYARAPTQAEMLPNPPPPQGWGGPTDVMYFDLGMRGKSPIAFGAGTVIDVWFPFVLDDSLSYRLSWVMGKTFSPPIHATIYDNVLHFALPSFSIAPPNTLQAEVEGFW